MTQFKEEIKGLHFGKCFDIAFENKTLIAAEFHTNLPRN